MEKLGDLLSLYKPTTQFVYGYKINIKASTLSLDKDNRVPIVHDKPVVVCKVGVLSLQTIGRRLSNQMSIINQKIMPILPVSGLDNDTYIKEAKKLDDVLFIVPCQDAILEKEIRGNIGITFERSVASVRKL